MKASGGERQKDEPWGWKGEKENCFFQTSNRLKK